MLASRVIGVAVGRGGEGERGTGGALGGRRKGRRCTGGGLGAGYAGLRGVVRGGGAMARPGVALRVTERLPGAAVMLEAARCRLIDPPRHDQRQCRHFAPSLTQCDRAILKVQHWLRPGRHSRLYDTAVRAGGANLPTSFPHGDLSYATRLPATSEGRERSRSAGNHFPAARPDCVGGRISGQWGFPENLHTIYGTATRRLSEAI